MIFNDFTSVGIHPNAKGALQVYELNKGEATLVLDSTKAHGVKCGTFGASGIEERHLATGDHAGTLAIYDLERDTAVYSAQAHTSIINAIDGCGGLEVGMLRRFSNYIIEIYAIIGYGAPELVTGGRDGCVRLWDPRVPDPVLGLEPGAGETARDCWTVAFGNSYSDEDRCIAAGYDNGDFKLFDLRYIFACKTFNNLCLELMRCAMRPMSQMELQPSNSIAKTLK